MLEKIKNTSRSSDRDGVIKFSDDKEIDFFEVGASLWRGKWIILAMGLLFAMIGGYYAYRVAVPKYTSTASLALQLNVEPLVDIESVVSGVSKEASSLQTELHVIKSRGLIAKLVNELDLLSDPEFNPTLHPEPTISLSKLSSFLTSLIGQSEDEALTEAEQTLRDQRQDEAELTATVSLTSSAISASIVRGTYLFRISATSTNRYKSQLMANTLAQLYIDDQVETKFQATEQAVKWLSERVTELEAELRRRENEIKDLRSNTDLINAESLQALNRQLIDVRDRLNETLANIAISEARLAKIQELKDAGDREGLAQQIDDPTLQRILAQINSGNETAVQLFEDRLNLAITREENSKTRLEQQSVALQDAVKRQQELIDVQSADFVKLQELERELEATRILYETFLTRLKEATVQRGLQQADSRILSKAIAGRYVEPQKMRIVLIAAFFGTVLGSAFVLFQQFVHSGFRTAEELEEYTGLPILGQIPKMEITRRDQLIDYLNTKSTSAASEAIRNLRTSVLLSDIDTPPQVIMSTSSVPGEGKTTQAISLAHNLSGMGRKVLLVEGDIRRRTFNEYFDGSGKRGGVLTAMTGETPIEDLIIRDSRMNVDILMGEKSSANAADIFSSAKFKEFIQNARDHYDIVIIDTPPVLVVPDARVIGQSVDAIIFTVAWDRTSKSQITESIRQFSTANLHLTGLVLSQVDPKGMRRYGYGGRYGAYAAYGEGYYDA